MVGAGWLCWGVFWKGWRCEMGACGILNCWVACCWEPEGHAVVD
jgi:hypothetical protein